MTVNVNFAPWNLRQICRRMERRRFSVNGTVVPFNGTSPSVRTTPTPRIVVPITVHASGVISLPCLAANATVVAISATPSFSCSTPFNRVVVAITIHASGKKVQHLSTFSTSSPAQVLGFLRFSEVQDHCPPPPWPRGRSYLSGSVSALTSGNDTRNCRKRGQPL